MSITEKKYDKEEFLLAIHEHFSRYENKEMRKVHAIRGNMSGWQQFEAAKAGGLRGAEVRIAKYGETRKNDVHS
jgi:hypothetical protein